MKADLAKRLAAGVSVAASLWCGVDTGHAILAYDNSTTRIATFTFFEVYSAVGDQIILDPTVPWREPTSFTFEYYLKGNPNLSGDEEARVGFYKNDGPLVSGYPSPNTVVWDSGWFSLPEGSDNGFGTISFDLSSLGLTLPDEFTVVFQIRNVTYFNEVAGLPIYGPITVGNNYQDYWAKTVGNPWQLLQYPAANVDMGMRIEVVPESSAIAFGSVLGLTGLVAARWLRNRRK